jgi:hypothetical protein
MRLDDIYEELLRLTSEAAVRPDVPLESEQFFSALVDTFLGSKEECIEFIRSNLRVWFTSMTEGPRWLQEPEWQFSGGKPMVFVGQIDVPSSRGYFHDDASFYLFWDGDTGEEKVVVQVA